MKDRFVVCVNEVFFPCHPNVGQLPKQGEIYTISSVYRSLNGKDYYILSELDPDDAFLVDHFRPVDDSFGEWVEETLMKDAVYEETLKELQS